MYTYTYICNYIWFLISVSRTTLLHYRKTIAVFFITVSSVPSSRSFLKQNRKSFPQLASTFSGCRATEQNSSGSLSHHILSLSSLLPLPFPTLVKNLKYLFHYPLEELPVNGRIPDSSQGLAGWEENGRKNRSKETMNVGCGQGPSFHL